MKKDEIFDNGVMIGYISLQNKEGVKRGNIMLIFESRQKTRVPKIEKNAVAQTQLDLIKQNRVNLIKHKEKQERRKRKRVQTAMMNRTELFKPKNKKYKKYTTGEMFRVKQDDELYSGNPDIPQKRSSKSNFSFTRGRITLNENDSSIKNNMSILALNESQSTDKQISKINSNFQAYGNDTKQPFLCSIGQIPQTELMTNRTQQNTSRPKNSKTSRTITVSTKSLLKFSQFGNGDNGNGRNTNRNKIAPLKKTMK